MKVEHDSEKLAEGLQVITACAFVHAKFDGEYKVFLPKRAATKKFLPGVFELPGGHIDFGEDIINGLKREIKEEFGMSARIGDPFAVFTYTNDIKKSHSIEVIYFAQFEDEITSIRFNPEDHSEYGWFSKAELEEATTPEKGLDDVEFKAILKGFNLLEAEQVDFGRVV